MLFDEGTLVCGIQRSSLPFIFSLFEIVTFTASKYFQEPDVDNTLQFEINTKAGLLQRKLHATKKLSVSDVIIFFNSVSL